MFVSCLVGLRHARTVIAVQNLLLLGKMRHDKTENMEVRESSVSMTRVVLVNGSGFIGHRVRQSPSRSRSRPRRLSLVQQLQHTLSPPCELIFAELVSARDHARVHEPARDLNVVSMWRPDAECSVLCAVPDRLICDHQPFQPCWPISWPRACW